MATVTLRGRFTAGTKVTLEQRNGDFYAASTGGVVAKGAVDDDGTVGFAKLDAGAQFWVVGDGRAVAVTAKDIADPPAKLKPVEVAAILSGTRPSTDLAERAHADGVARAKQLGKPDPDGGRIDAAGKTPLESATPLGEAVPVEDPEAA